jgi:hypothetical protein
MWEFASCNGEEKANMLDSLPAGDFGCSTISFISSTRSNMTSKMKRKSESIHSHAEGAQYQFD